jgi:ABC-2 type transport system ATP-binding protein
MSKPRAEFVVEARGLSFAHPGSSRKALERLSLGVRSGSFLGLLGPNGAGKTTFVNLICGLLRADSGQLEVFGKRPRSAAARRRIGLCPQELALYPALSAAENLRFFGRLAGLSGRRLRSRVGAVLELVRLAPEAQRRVGRFSGGMQRRLNLATALVHEPDLLLLDEPTVGVDPQSRLAIYAALEELSASGATILYTSHYMDEVERLCDEVLVIDHGRVLTHGPTAEVVARGRRAAAFRLSLAADRDAQPLIEEAERQGLHARLVEGGELELAGDDLAALMEEVARLTRRGDIARAQTHRPTLEESFLELTGKELRDR